MLELLTVDPIAFLILALSLVISLTIHEFAHAFVAVKLGDPTPKLDGRVSLNPLRHLDPIGTLAILLIGFGWGRPVVFNPFNLKNPRMGTLLVAAAGPLSNLILATVLIILLPFLPFFPLIWQFVASVNIALAVFNLIPIHPLDGGKILSGLLPADLSEMFEEIMHRYGFPLLIILLIPVFGGRSIISYTIQPGHHLVESGIYWLAGFLHSLV